MADFYCAHAAIEAQQNNRGAPSARRFRTRRQASVLRCDSNTLILAAANNLQQSPLRREHADHRRRRLGQCGVVCLTARGGAPRGVRTAIELYDKLLVGFPASPYVKCQLALAKYNLREFDEAQVGLKPLTRHPRTP